MSEIDPARRSFIESMLVLPFGLAAQAQAPPPRRAVEKVAAGSGRSRGVIKLPGGDLLYVKVATADTGGAMFMTEQPIERRGLGPPKHYHENQDEWFYCLAGEYVVEIGDGSSSSGTWKREANTSATARRRIERPRARSMGS